MRQLMMLDFANQLQIETNPLGSRYLAGEIDFPGRPNVLIVIRPPSDVSLTDPGMLAECEVKCGKIISILDLKLRAAIPILETLLDESYKGNDMPASASILLESLALTHVKLMYQSGDELIFECKRFDHDLNVRLSSDGAISEAWFDG